MAERYPEIEPYASGMLAVADGHELYWETVGDPGGVPAVYLHGGPGSGCGLGHLHRAWPASRLVVLDDAGHGGADMTAAVVEAVDGFRDAR